jgi:MoxR-like ATPase
MAEKELRYSRIFDPDSRRGAKRRSPVTGYGDQRGSPDYVYTEQITLAVNVALATARPLLIQGPAGSGKSSLASDIARRMEWDFYEEVISSRTQARDLCWTFDAVQRLRDAQAQLPVDRPEAYVRPGILWRALDPSGAADLDPGGAGDNDGGPQSAPREGAVVLLDEIDKADPDTPNDLLVPLGSGTFRVTDLGTDITLRRALQPLVLVTTNNERELPKAFMRRCVVLHLPEPSKEWLAVVAAAHYGSGEQALYDQVAGYVIEARKRAEAGGERPPSTAEFLDALQACRELGIRPGTEAWNKVALATLAKWLPPKAPS